MFGLGIWEVALVLIVALLVLGPEKLPVAAKKLGRIVRDLRRVANDFQSHLHAADDDELGRPSSWMDGKKTPDRPSIPKRSLEASTQSKETPDAAPQSRTPESRIDDGRSNGS